MGVGQNKATLARFDRLAAHGEVDALDEVCTPHLLNHALASHRTPGLEGTKEFLRECQLDPAKAAWRRSMIFDQQVVTIGEGDYVIQYGTRSGTWPGGRFRGIDVRPGDYAYEVAFMYRFEGGRITERWAVRDDLAMIQQLNDTSSTPPSVRSAPLPRTAVLAAEAKR
jgi:SnoaL-like polyketide cyclase